MEYKLIPTNELKKMAEKAERSNKQWVVSFNKKQANKLDTVVHSLHHQIFDRIDCLQCANCCKSISPTLYDKDIERLAKGLKMKASEFIEMYLVIDEENDFVFRNTPRPFLDGNNYCMIYENRPKACREYPHTNRSRFYQILKLTIKNTFVCPAAYYIMEELNPLSGKNLSL